ncbi:MAG: DUF177 domain-containing protein [Chloroflexales bacterium]|nr:DUF177 domain-containing protein [Chloroflexales bacterium]
MTDIKFNVAQLLRDVVGARRDHTFSEARLSLDDDLTLRQIEGTVRFTRTASGVYASAQARGVVRMECVRSLEEFDQPVDFKFADEFHAVVDVMTAVSLPKPDEEDPFFIDDRHMIDLGEAIREYTLLELPMNPVSPAYRDRPVQASFGDDNDEPVDAVEAPVDERLFGLKEWARRNGQA